MATFSAFADQNRKRFEEELFAFLEIRSVSTEPTLDEDTFKAAEFTEKQLHQCGLESVRIITGKGHPLVYGEWCGAPGKPTILLYGHYDVQPVDPLKAWISTPFEPEIRDGNIYARGASDDKGQLMANLKALECLHQESGKFPVNIKVLVEGEEEVGGESVAEFVASNRELLASDAALISDTAMYAPDTPTICTGVRGLVYTEWRLQGAKSDLHSGLYGGVAPNALFELATLLAKCKDEDGRVTIPGFYDAVCEPSEAERTSWEQIPFDEQTYREEEVRAPVLMGESGFSVFERTGSRPTFEVHGIRGGFTGDGAKTVIPASASAKVSVRLVPDQDPADILRKMREFAVANAPSGIPVEVRLVHSAPAALAPPDHPIVRTAARALEEVWKRETVFIRSGGSIPVVGDFKQHLGIPTVLMGYGLPDDNLHAPNEKFSRKNFHLGIASTGRFLQLLSNESNR